jgi:hypothetical protein
MAENKKYYHNIDLIKNKLSNPILNPLTSTQRNALTSTLGVADEGYVCFDTTLNQQYFWDGTTWITTGGGGGGSVNAVTATSPLTSTGGSTPNISTAISTNKLIGRASAGTGVMEEITLGTGLSFSGTTLNASAAVTPAALTKTNDTNVTLTLGGTPNTALLQSVSLTLGWTGTLADSRIASATNWNTAYTNRITSLTTTGTSGAATLIANVLNIPQYSSSTTASVTADLTVGAINAGDTVASGTTLQQFVVALLNKIYYPTLNAPSFSLSNNQGTLEIGTTISVILTFTFNRGSILGSTSGTWNPSYFQNYRAGASTSYTINGTTQSGNTLTVSRTVAATNSFSGTVTYAIGPQPLDSKGNNYSTPLAGATSSSQPTSFTGIYPYYWYRSSSPITASSMQSAIASGAATKVVGDSTGTITINFAATGQYLAFAYPATSTTKTVWYVNALDNGTIPGGVFGGQTTLACSSSSGYWSSVNYKIHVTAGLITQSNDMELRNS